MKYKVKRFAALVLLLLATLVFISSCSLFDKEESFTLTFMCEGTEYHKIETNGNEVISLPDAPTKDGYTFGGWYFDDGVFENGLTENTLAGTALTENKTVYAKFDKIPEEPPAPVTLVGIEIVDKTVETSCEVGDTIDTSALKVLATYSDGSTEEIGVSKLVVTLPDTTRPGISKLTVKYKTATASVSITVNEPPAPVTLLGISIVHGTVSDTVMAGDEYSISTLKVLATYSDGSSVELNTSDVAITLPNTATAGTSELTVKYGGFTATITVTVTNELTGIEFVSGSIPTSYDASSVIDTTGVKILAVYSDGTSAEIGSSLIEITPPATNVVGTHKMSLKYGGFEIFVDIEIYKTLTSVEIKSGTVASSVYVGEALATDGLVLIARYSDGSTREIGTDNTDLTVSSVDTSTAGVKTLTAEYLGKSATASVTVLEPTPELPTLVGIEFVPGSIPTSYDASSVIDTTGVKILAVYSDGTSAEIGSSLIEITPPATNVVGTYKMSLKYGGFEIFVDIEIYKTLTSVEIKGGTVASSVYVGEALATDGLVLIARYSDGSTREIGTDNTDLTVSSVDTSTAGVKTLTAEYLGKSATASITVLEPTPEAPTLTGIELNTDSFKTTYKLGEALSKKESIVITLKYSNGNTLTLPAYSDGVANDKITITGYESISTSSAGNYTLTLAYADSSDSATASVKITVLGIESVTVSGVDVTIKVGDSFDLSSATVTVSYTDGSVLVFEGAKLLINEEIPAGADAQYVKITHNVSTKVSGTYTLTASYLGHTAELDVIVKSSTLLPDVPVGGWK